MATMTGNDGAITISGNTMAAVRSFSIDMTSDTIETTTMGNDTRQYVKGMSTYSGSADIYFDPSEFGDNGSIYNPTTTLVGAAGVAGKFYLDQDATNDVVFFANSMIVTGYSVTSSMDGMVEASLSFQGSGASGFSATGNA
jgi:hypothetical protein